MHLPAREVANNHLRMLGYHKDLRAVAVSVEVDLQTIFLPMILQVIGGTAKDEAHVGVENFDEEPGVMYSNESLFPY